MSDQTYQPPAEQAGIPKMRQRGPSQEQKEAETAQLRKLAAVIAPDGFTTQEEFEEFNQRVAEIREQRQPFGTYTQKLAYEARPHYHRHWFNDVDGRVLQAEAAGYSHVKDHASKVVSRVTGRLKEGGPMFSYLMEIPKVLHDEDMKANLSRDDEIEADIKRGHATTKDKTDESQGNNPYYIPKTGIKIKGSAQQSG